LRRPSGLVLLNVFRLRWEKKRDLFVSGISTWRHAKKEALRTNYKLGWALSWLMAASSKNSRKNEREKARRGEINEQFVQLSDVLGTPACASGQNINIPRREKQSLLAAACRTIKDLQNQQKQLLFWHSALTVTHANPEQLATLQQLLPSVRDNNVPHASLPALAEERADAHDRPPEAFANSPARMGHPLTLSPIQQFPHPFSDIESMNWYPDDAPHSMNQFVQRSTQPPLISSGQESEAKIDDMTPSVTREHEAAVSPSSYQSAEARRKRKRSISSSSHDE